MQPINYLAQLPNMNEVIQQGLQTGSMMGQAIQAPKIAQQQAELLRQQEEVKKQREMARQAEIERLMANPTARGAMGLALQFPELQETIKNNWGALSTEQKQTELQSTAQIISAFKAKKPQLAIDMMKRKAAAFDNSGDAQNAKYWNDAATFAEQDPNAALTMAMVTTGALPEGKTLLENIFGVEEQPYNLMEAQAKGENAQPMAEANLEKAQADASKATTEAQYAPQQQQVDIEGKYAEIAKKQADAYIASQQLGQGETKLAIDKGALELEYQKQASTEDANKTTLPPALAGMRDASVGAAVDYRGQANAARSLIGIISAEGMSGGSLERLTTGAGAVLGNDTSLRRQAINDQYQQFMTGVTLSKLAQLKGASSNKEMDEIKSGAPPLNASADRKVRFMTTWAKALDRLAIQEESKADWLSANGTGGLGAARKAFVIPSTGEIVPAGQTFTNWLTQRQTARNPTLSPQGQAMLRTARGGRNAAPTGIGVIPKGNK